MSGWKSVSKYRKINEFSDDPEDNKNPIDVQVGSRIRMRRIMLGYSAKLLSDAVGVTEAQLIKWENGADRVGSERLREISAALHESASAFFDDTDWSGVGTTADPGWVGSGDLSNGSSCAENQELFWAFSRITDAAARKRLLAFALALASDREPRN